MINYATITFVGLITLGVVNVITWFWPTLDSKYKFTAAVAVAFAVTFIPVSLGNILLTHLKTALEVASASSGVYKLASKAGGK